MLSFFIVSHLAFMKKFELQKLPSCAPSLQGSLHVFSGEGDNSSLFNNALLLGQITCCNNVDECGKCHVEREDNLQHF